MRKHGLGHSPGKLFRPWRQVWNMGNMAHIEWNFRNDKVVDVCRLPAGKRGRARRLKMQDNVYIGPRFENSRMESDLHAGFPPFEQGTVRYGAQRNIIRTHSRHPAARCLDKQPVAVHSHGEIAAAASHQMESGDLTTGADEFTNKFPGYALHAG